MIGISKLYCGTVEPSDALRYGRRSQKLPSHLLQFSEDKKPVVVWNMTRACNLSCLHCYAQAVMEPGPDELSTEEGLALIDHLAEFGSPVMLFSGGEPLIRPDLLTLVKRAVGRGLRAVISTNGTLITPRLADELSQVGLSYVGVSLDGLAPTNDHFRGRAGAFEAALAGIRHARRAGLKVGLRFTISGHNAAELPAIFDLIEAENIPRACFYHLVYSGRGDNLQADDLNHQQTRAAVDFVIDRTRQLHDQGRPVEILTVDNHADGPYLYLRLLREGRVDRAAQVLELLKMNGGNSSGVGIAAISWDGRVHPDQFWREVEFGNVRESSFADIWQNQAGDLLMKLKNKRDHVTGRCRECRFLEVCGGGLRARAAAIFGDPWAPDPACYLTDEEIKADNPVRLNHKAL